MLGDSIAAGPLRAAPAGPVPTGTGTVADAPGGILNGMCMTVNRSQASGNPFGGITNGASGDALTDPAGSTANGTPLQLAPSRGDLDEPWARLLPPLSEPVSEGRPPPAG